VNGWNLAKYALALSGLALVLGAERLERPWVGYIGLGLLVAAFALRFVQRRFDTRRDGMVPRV
jgi:hydrogenase/urease accessory protein HupE